MDFPKNAFESCTVIINPYRYPKRARVFINALRVIGAPRIIECRDRNHLIDAVGDFQRGSQTHLLLWGGDGTINDAINVLVCDGAHNKEAAPKSIGFFRGGSGNGYHDSYEVPVSLHNQLQCFSQSISSDYKLDVDLLRIEHNSRVFYGQLIGVGFAVEVLKRRNRRISSSRSPEKTKPGLLNYVFSTLITFSKLKKNFHRELKPNTLEMNDGKYLIENTRVMAETPFKSLTVHTFSPMIEIGKRPYYGNHFKICPGTVCNNGIMDAFLFNFKNKRSVMMNLWALWNGQHGRINYRSQGDDRPIIEHYRIREMTIISNEPFDYHIDGELTNPEWGESDIYSLSISILPRAISFIVPGSFYKKFHAFEEPRTRRT